MINTMDSRELQDRIDELELFDRSELGDDEKEELNELLELKEQTEDEGWEYGILFIDTDDFEEYAQELAEDIGAIDRNAQWPLYHIDWEAAAESLSQDYSTVTFRGTDYYYREA